MIYLASDHGGFKLKLKIKTHLQKQNIDVEDLGPFEHIPDDDYPDYIIPAMKKIQQNIDDKAIIICRNGVGVSMLANKFKEIRCALTWNKKHAISSKLDDNSNVIALPADYISDGIAYAIVDGWLETDFSNAERHNRRLNKFENLGENL